MSSIHITVYLLMPAPIIMPTEQVKSSLIRPYFGHPRRGSCDILPLDNVVMFLLFLLHEQLVFVELQFISSDGTLNEIKLFDQRQFFKVSVNRLLKSFLLIPNLKYIINHNANHY